MYCARSAFEFQLTLCYPAIKICAFLDPDQPGNLGGTAVRYLAKFGYPGAVWPVNPRRETAVSAGLLLLVHRRQSQAENRSL